MMTVGNLADHPAFLPLAANRIWAAWWAHHGTPEADVVDGLKAIVAMPDFPFALVALCEGAYAGHVLAIADDLAERPDLTPWIAALWVEPPYRRKGVAVMLMEAAAAKLAEQGRDICYLCAKPVLRGFYEARGWKLFETEVGATSLDVLQRELRDIDRE